MASMRVVHFKIKRMHLTPPSSSKQRAAHHLIPYVLSRPRIVVSIYVAIVLAREEEATHAS